LRAELSVNQRFPSGPAAMKNGAWPDGTGNSAIVPAGVIRPMPPPVWTVNQTFPSGPFARYAAMP